MSEGKGQGYTRYSRLCLNTKAFQGVLYKVGGLVEEMDPVLARYVRKI